MAAGVAVVATDGTSLPEVLGDAGVLVREGDVAGWSSALGRLLDDPAARERLGRAGRARAARHTPIANAEGFAALYRRALSAG
jgi:glycosyltransferase involved in cell wall biosynthesis